MRTRTSPLETEPDKLAAELRRLVAEAERLLGESERNAPAGGAAPEGRFERARAGLTSAGAATRERVVRGAQATDAAIRRHPYQALALAAGIGLVLGVVLGRRSGR